MAVQIIDGSTIIIVDGGTIDSGAEVYGGSWGPRVVYGGWIGDSAGVYGGDVDGLYLVVNGDWIDQDDDDLLFGGAYLVRPLRSYRRIQLEGGGRTLFEACIDDEAHEFYFELWKNGRRFPLVNVSNPVFSWLSPSGATGQAVSRVEDGERGRVRVRLFEPHEYGVWKIQVRYVDEVNFDELSRGQRPPYAPPTRAREYWRRLPKALLCLVSDEGRWS